MTVVIPYGGSAGWTYKAGPAGHSPGFQAPDYDASGWSVGSLPAGITNPVSGPACGPAPIRTPWVSSHNDDFLVRRELPRGMRDLTVQANADDNVAVWLNGVLLIDQGDGTISAGPTGLLTPDPSIYDPTTHEGPNVLAVRARDRMRVCAYVDVEVTFVDAGGWKVGQVAIS